MKNTRISIIITVLCTIFFLFSCNKQHDNLYSISISANAMVGTPAENFSLQHIKMFQASNTFMFDFWSSIASDTSVKNFAVAPFYMINNLLLDTSLVDWKNAYLQHNNLSVLTHNQMQNTVISFLQTVKEIDSSLNIQSNIASETDSSINISQILNIKLMYSDSAPNDVDNIFTTYDNRKPRMDFITVTDNIRTFIGDEEEVTELPLYNGNYMLMFIRPLHRTIMEYMTDFTEKKFSYLINNMQQRQINVALPLINVSLQQIPVILPDYNTEDSLICFPKTLFINTEFSLSCAGNTDINEMNTKHINDNILKNNTSSPVKFNTPFIFIVRGKNSNLIMFCGFFNG